VATLSELVSQIADLTDIPKATIFAYGRFAREGGLISQRGRGRGGASMTATDVANLLIALSGTSVTREAAKAIALFRPMIGYAYFPVHDIEAQFRDWLPPFSPPAERWGRINCNFGMFFEWLIEESMSGTLYDLLLKTPILAITDEKYELMAKNHPEMTVDAAVENGVLVPSVATKDDIGTEIQLSISFDRSTPQVDFLVRRNWNGWQEICELEFGYDPPIHQFRSEIVTYTKITEQVIFFLGQLLRDKSRSGG
jgi:hypothetical protein